MRRLSGILLIASSVFAHPSVKSEPPAGVDLAVRGRFERENGLAHLRAATARLTPGPLVPDHAIVNIIVDMTAPPAARFPGKIAQAGFFNEDWLK